MSKKLTLILISIFFGIKLIAYSTAYNQTFSSLFTLTATITMAVFFLLKKRNWAWRLFIGELLLCGSGAYFELFDLSMRTWFLFIFLGLWFIYEYKNINKKHLLMALIPLFIVFISSIVGLARGNEIKSIFQDALPFAYILVYFPTIKYLQNKQEISYLKNLLVAFIISSIIYSLFIFIMFSTGFMEIHGIYYKWFRDFGLGKITDLGNNFFRVVLPEHLLITPLLLFIIFSLIKQKSRLSWFLLFSCAVILALNFSRGYFLGMTAGLIILMWKNNFKRWLFVSTISLLIIVTPIVGLSFMASKGQTWGLDLIGIRVGSVARPTTEESSATRMTLLPNILNKIKSNPVVGAGLGSTVTYHNAFLAQDITTRQYDWGYLEIIAEFGIPLALLLSLTYFVLITQSVRKKNTAVLTVFAFLLVSNLTAPILTHLLGIFCLVIILSSANLLPRPQLT